MQYAMLHYITLVLISICMNVSSSATSHGNASSPIMTVIEKQAVYCNSVLYVVKPSIVNMHGIFLITFDRSNYG